MSLQMLGKGGQTQTSARRLRGIAIGLSLLIGVPPLAAAGSPVMGMARTALIGAVGTLPTAQTTITASPWAGAGLAGIKASVPSVAGSTYAWTVTGGTITAGASSNQVTYTAGAAGTLALQCVVTNAGDNGTGTFQQTLTSVLDISGTFTGSQPGTVTFYQTGTSVYGLQSGVVKFQGTLSGQVLTGADPTKTSNQYFKFTFAPDASSFTGIYNAPTAAATSGNGASGTRQTGVVSIDLTPKFNVIQVNGTQAMTAVVAGSLDKSCTITSTVGTVDGTGLFTAPATPQLVTLTATATADPSKTSTFTSQVTSNGILDISGTFTGSQPGTVTFYQTGTSVYGVQSGVVKFQGTLSGQVLTGADPTKTTNQYFKFTFASDASSFTGLYNAPATPVTTGTNASGTRQTGVSIDLTPKFNVIQVNGTQAMTAVVAGSLDKSCTITSTVGTVDGTGLFTAPATPQLVTLTATATADPSKTSTFTSQVTSNGILDVSGTFTGSFPGLVTFYQTGTSVYGVQSGVVKFQGTLSGQVLTGADPTKTTNQYFKFTFASDASSFTGLYNAPATPVTTGTNGNGTRQAGVVSIDLTPKFNVIQVNGTQAMTAVVAGSLDKSCTIASTVGAVDGAGLFTAPSTPQLVTLTATATADPSKTSTFTSQVTNDGILDVTGTFTGSQPGTVTFYQAGSTVYGVQSGVAKFQGTLSGQVLTGTQPGTAYYFKFTFASDASTFTGTFNATTPAVTSGATAGGTRQAGVSVWITPVTAMVPSDQTQNFLPLVAGSLDKRLTSLVVQESGGGTVTSGGLYTPPATAGTYHLVATALADPTKTGTAVITVPVVVRISPVSAQLDLSVQFPVSGGTQVFAATVLGTTNQAVTWAIQEGPAGGSIDASGNYTAPTTDSGVFHVVATSVQVPAANAVATVTVTNPQANKLIIAPSQMVMAKGGTQSFTATQTHPPGGISGPVDWSCTGGTIQSLVSGGSGMTYVAPSVYGTFTITASLHSDPSIRDTATIVVPGGTASGAFTYDANGNMTSDGARTFTWDAENRLVSVIILATGHVSQFTYDEFGRRVEIVEQDSGTTTSDTKYLWEGAEIAESRTAAGGTVLQHYYSQGFVDSDGTDLYYTRDHLGSVRELTDGSQALRARYDYDPYGRMTKTGGDKDSSFGYAGYYWHSQSELSLTFFRVFDSRFGRWLSKDPIQEAGGLNQYSYVLNNPISLSDQFGLSQGDPGWDGSPEHVMIWPYPLQPLYGNWGGGGWFGGGDPNWWQHPDDPSVAPIDDLDKIFKEHDLSYYKCKQKCKNNPCPDFKTCVTDCQKIADKKLVEEILHLPKYARDWHPRWDVNNPIYIQDSMVYRQLALDYFK